MHFPCNIKQFENSSKLGVLKDRDPDPQIFILQSDRFIFEYVMGAWLQFVHVSKRTFAGKTLLPEFSFPHGLTFPWYGCYGLYLRHKPTELAHSFYSVLASVSVFMALSTVFHSKNSPDDSALSHSVLLVLFLPYWSFQPYISLLKPPSTPDINLRG